MTDFKDKHSLASLAGKKVAVLGWGINGRDAASYLRKLGAQITVFDEKEEGELDFSDFDKGIIKVVLGKDYLKGGLAGFDYVFRAPGVYRYLPEIVRAEKSGTVVTSAVNFFFQLCPGKIIGVTGTKGKGTTSTLIYQILKRAKKDVYLAGNIGTPILDLLPRLKKKSWVVLELSSFQLIDMTKSPHLAVVLNITEDHMDWHKDRAEYVNAKKNIVRHQSAADYAVLNRDYVDSRRFRRETNASVFWFSASRKVRGSYVNRKGEIILNLSYGGGEGKICDTGELLLRGKHNWENVCAAACASAFTGLTVDDIRKTVVTFKGLEHRLELAGEVKKRKFYNDSFSTNPQTTTAAIRAFEEPLTLILGGSDKGLDYDEMGKEIAKSKNVLHVVLIGEIAGLIKKSIDKAKYKGSVVELGSPSMETLVKKSFGITPAGGIVLLSPATASFDMFADYKDRGEQFKVAVKNLSR